MPRSKPVYLSHKDSTYSQTFNSEAKNKVNLFSRDFCCLISTEYSNHNSQGVKLLSKSIIHVVQSPDFTKSFETDISSKCGSMGITCSECMH